MSKINNASAEDPRDGRGVSQENTAETATLSQEQGAGPTTLLETGADLPNVLQTGETDALNREIVPFNRSFALDSPRDAEAPKGAEKSAA